MQPELHKLKTADEIDAIHRSTRAAAFWFITGVFLEMPIILLFLSYALS